MANWLRRGIALSRSRSEPRFRLRPQEWGGVIEGKRPLARHRHGEIEHGLDSLTAAHDPDLDPTCPLLSRSQAAWLRRLTRQTLAENGLECTVAGMTATDANGATYRLWSLAGMCRDRPESDWPEYVRNHVVSTLAASSRRFTSADLARCRVRLVELDSLPSVDRLAHCQAVAPGLVEVLVIDRADALLIPSAGAVAGLGPAADLAARGRANLRTLIRRDLSAVTVRTRDGLSFTSVQADSPYVASLSLVLPDLISALEPEADTRRGVFVAVPNRRQLAYRPVVGLSSLMSVQPLAAFAQARYSAGVEPLSPHVYWVRGDSWEQLTFAHGERVAIHVSAELTAAIDEEP